MKIENQIYNIQKKKKNNEEKINKLIKCKTRKNYKKIGKKSCQM